MTPAPAIYLNDVGVVCSLGMGQQAVREQLWRRDEPQGLTWTDRHSVGVTLPLGVVAGPLPALHHAASVHRTRNNALAAAALAQIRAGVEAAIARHGPRRIGIIVGTSTSGLPEGEAARRTFLQAGRWPEGFDYAQQELGSVANFLAAELGVHGPAHVISTACSSGAKALASGARLLRAGLLDAVVAGGVDALADFTVAGFRALESVSEQRCNPLSANRRGINLGEGAALFLMSRDAAAVRLAGWGETSDAHHVSAPDPSGQGAIRAMQEALNRAGLPPAGVDYVNLHGTATHHNDAMESLAVAAVLGSDVPVSSTKPLTGHTLAAAGAIEAAFAWLTLTDNPLGMLPPHWWDGQVDPSLQRLAVAEPGARSGRPVNHVMSHSFAFGGSNAVLLFGRG